MIRNVFAAALAGTAAIAAPALARPGAAGPANVHVNTNTNSNVNASAGMNARVNSQGSMSASTKAQTNANVNSAVHANTVANTNANANVNTNATNSQGLQHASPTGIAHASPNSVLARGSVQATALPGLTTGLTVNDSTGASIGTVNQIVTGTDGSIRAVIVTKTDGGTIRLAPTTLSISGGVVTTTTPGG